MEIRCVELSVEPLIMKLPVIIHYIYSYLLFSCDFLLVQHHQMLKEEDD